MSLPPDPAPHDPSSSEPGLGGYGQGGYGPAYGPTGITGPGRPRTQSNGLAVASLATGIISVVLGPCSFVFSVLGPVAVLLGLKAQRRSDDSGGLVGGRGMATAGLVLGVLGTLLLVLEAAWFAYVKARGGDLTFRLGSSG